MNLFRLFAPWLRSRQDAPGWLRCRMRRAWRLGALVLMLAGWNLHAGLTLNLFVLRDEFNFTIYTVLSTNAALPAPTPGGYIIRSPHYPTNGTESVYNLDGGGLHFVGGISAGANTFEDFMTGLTNGVWTLQITNNTATNVYTFTVTAAGLSSNLFTPVSITYPPEGDPDVPPIAVFTWTNGPVGWEGTLDVGVHDWTYSFYEFEFLSVTATRWTNSVPLSPGSYNFYVYYRSNATGTIVASTPVDGSMNPLAGWLSSAAVEVADSSYFDVQATGAPPGQVTLLAHFRFDDEFNLGLDSSTNGFDLDASGTWGDGDYWFDTDAIAGPGAVYFSAPDSGSGAYLSWNPTPAPILGALASNFSVSVWIKTGFLIVPTDLPPGDAGIVAADIPGTAYDVTPVALSSGAVAFNTGGDFDTTTYSSALVTDGVYHHVVVTRDQVTGRKQIYVDGVLDTTEFDGAAVLDAPVLLALGGFLDASESDPGAAAASNGYDGWLDDVQIYAGILSSNQVAFLYAHPGQVVSSSPGTNEPVEVQLELRITRTREPGFGDLFLCYPSLSVFNPPAVTQHTVKSPNEKFTGTPNSSSSWVLNSLEEVIEECTNGVWSLYINEGDLSERIFTFSMVITNLDTNLLAPVVILSPADGSVNVPTNPPFVWSGPVGFSVVYAGKYEPPFNNVVTTNLPGNATNWPSPPLLNPGTNLFYVYIQSFDFPHVSFSLPVDGNNYPLASWSAFVNLVSMARAEFVVGTPLTPVQLIHPQRLGTNFQFQFLTQAGRSNVVQSRTNLTLGGWVNRTSILGDGTLKTVVLPMSGLPTEFFRVLTQ